MIDPSGGPPIAPGWEMGIMLTHFAPDPIDDNLIRSFLLGGLPYVGWTEPGEWINITVDVAHAKPSDPDTFRC